MTETTFKIEFADHVSQSHEEGILSELSQMGASIAESGHHRSTICLGGNRSEYIRDFLLQEEMRGTLVINSQT